MEPPQFVYSLPETPTRVHKALDLTMCKISRGESLQWGQHILHILVVAKPGAGVSYTLGALTPSDADQWVTVLKAAAGDATRNFVRKIRKEPQQMNVGETTAGPSTPTSATSEDPPRVREGDADFASPPAGVRLAPVVSIPSRSSSPAAAAAAAPDREKKDLGDKTNGLPEKNTRPPPATDAPLAAPASAAAPPPPQPPAASPLASAPMASAPLQATKVLSKPSREAASALSEQSPPPPAASPAITTATPVDLAATIQRAAPDRSLVGRLLLPTLAYGLLRASPLAHFRGLAFILCLVAALFTAPRRPMPGIKVD